MKATVKMCQMLKAENTKLKQEKEELQEQIIALNTVVSCVERNDLKIDKIKEYCEMIKEKYKFFDKSNTTEVHYFEIDGKWLCVESF